MALCLCALALLSPCALIAGESTTTTQRSDSIRTYWVTPIEVTAQRTYMGRSSIPIEKDNLSRVLERSGFKLIRKGVFFAQDVYADGLKRGDIT
jgi:hypothetical protein